MSWSCCKEDNVPEFRPQLVEEPKPPAKVKPRDVQDFLLLQCCNEVVFFWVHNKIARVTTEDCSCTFKGPRKREFQQTDVQLVAYILKHEEDDDEQEQDKKQDQLQTQIQEMIQDQLQGLIKEWNREQQGPLGQDDDLAKPSTSDAKDLRERGTQTNPRYFPRSPGRVTLDEILRGMQRIQFVMDNTVRDFEQRISRLERIVLKMRNAWIHHRTCHLEGLEYDEHEG